jgi:hypothetical protein
MPPSDRIALLELEQLTLIVPQSWRLRVQGHNADRHLAWKRHHFSPFQALRAFFLLPWKKIRISTS